MNNDERRSRDTKRMEYLKNHMGVLAESNSSAFLRSIEARVLLAVNDIYGSDTTTMRFLESVLKTGEPHPAVFNEVLLYEGVSLIDPKEAEHLAIMLGYDLLLLYNGDLEYYKDDNLYGLWEHLEHAGMTHENIGRYFERFNEEKN